MSSENENIESDNADSDPLLELERLGFSADEAELLDSTGFASELGILEKWKADFPEDSASTIIDYLRVGHLSAPAWRRAEVDPVEIESWLSEDFIYSEDVAAYRSAGLSPRSASQWRKYFGDEAPGLASLWQEAGFASSSDASQLEEVRDWIDRGFLDPQEAAAWREQGFSSLSASTWVSLQCLDPKVASAWAQLDFTPELAHRVLFTDETQLSAGWVSPAEVTARGVSLPELKAPDGDTAAQLMLRWGQYFDLAKEEDPIGGIWEWIRHGVEDPEVAAGWVKVGCIPESAFEWRSHGCSTPVWAFAWWELGFSALKARDFIEDRLGVVEWESPERFYDPQTGSLPSPQSLEKSLASA